MSNDIPTVHVLAGGDLVVATKDEWVADNQYLVMVGANLDVERYRMTSAQWTELRSRLQALNPAPTIADHTNERGNA